MFAVHLIQKVIQGDGAGMIEYLRVLCAEQKPGGIQRIGIKKRESRLKTLLESRIPLRVLFRLYE